MHYAKPFLISIVLLFAVSGAPRAQNSLRIGEWRAHLPFKAGITVTQDDEKVYYGTSDGIVAITKDSNAVEFFSKVEGLSDVAITLVKYQQANDVLIVAYENSNIDLVFADGVVNIDDILSNNTIVGSKAINGIYTDNSDIIYISCDFGLVEFNIATRKFGFTMFTGTPVLGFVKFGNAYWIATDEGIYSFDKFNSELVSNFNAWDLITTELGLPSSYNAQGVAVFAEKLFVAADDALYALEEGEFLLWDARDEHFINFISSEGEHLKVGFRCPDEACRGKIHFYSSEGKVGEHGFDCTGQPTYAIEDEDGRVWYADEYEGIRKAEFWKWGCEYFEFNAPYSANVSELAVRDNMVFLAAGGVQDNYNALRRPDGFAILDDGEWGWFNRINTPFINEKGVLDHFRVLPHYDADSTILYIGSYWAGLLEYNWVDSTFRHYDQDNSALQGAEGDEQRERVAGLAYDDQNNLWMTCHSAPRPLVVMKPDKTWQSFEVESVSQLGQVIVDRRGYKWCAVVLATQGLLVYDDNGTLDNPNDDRQRVFTTNNSNLPTSNLTNLTMDRNGDIWVGTSMGPVVFDGGANPFEGNNHGYRITVEQDGVLAYLLGEEEVTAIAIDGANQKWIGTKNGVFVQSPDGEVEVATFNEENSPLLNNIITDIAINPEDGEVFIGTESGLISVRGEAIEGRAFHDPNAFAYPNPVRPDYEGPIAIKGLAENAAVKITNVAGRVVFETRALGGQAIWDGNDFDGQRAQSGVYLVFSTTEDTFNKPDALVTKILVVN